MRDCIPGMKNKLISTLFTDDGDSQSSSDDIEMRECPGLDNSAADARSVLTLQRL